MTPGLRDILQAHIGQRGTGWSLGEFGALAEFHHVKGTQTGFLAAHCDAGALVIHDIACTPVAYESPATRPGHWQHGLALCLPEARARMHGRRAITRLGLDADAPGAHDRGAWLFDLGLGLTTADFCVRTSDPALVARLDAACGSRLVDDRRLFDQLIAASPHRVLLSRVARIEVRSPIPRAGSRSPDGPHTHLLPRLLNRQVVHSANLPIAHGMLPCLYMYPPHPLESDDPAVFDRAAHDDFQDLLQRFGAPSLWAAKQQMLTAMRQGKPPGAPDMASSRHARLALRVALRQWLAQGGDVGCAASWEQALRSRNPRSAAGEPAESVTGIGHRLTA